jgi:hypothetical protein
VATDCEGAVSDWEMNGMDKIRAIERGLNRIQKLLGEILEELRKPQTYIDISGCDGTTEHCPHRYTYEDTAGTHCSQCGENFGVQR